MQMIGQTTRTIFSFCWETPSRKSWKGIFVRSCQLQSRYNRATSMICRQTVSIPNSKRTLHAANIYLPTDLISPTSPRWRWQRDPSKRHPVRNNKAVNYTQTVRYLWLDPISSSLFLHWNSESYERTETGHGVADDGARGPRRHTCGPGKAGRRRGRGHMSLSPRAHPCAWAGPRTNRHHRTSNQHACGAP